MEEANKDYYYCFSWFLFLIMIIVAYVFIFLILKAILHLWWIPRKVHQHFTKQGIKGPKYKFFFGNLKEIAMLSLSPQPLMPLSHDILPRVLSFYSHWNKIYGSTFVKWFGPTARVTISDPAILREIFVTKSEFFEKNEAPPLIKMLEGDGLLSLKGEKWAHHRKIITPTFYLENLKLMIPTMGKGVAEMLEKWSEMSSNGRVEIEVCKCFQTLAESVITHVVFGSSCYQHGRAIFHLQAQLIAYATDAFQKVFIPGYRFLPTRKNRIFWRLDKEVRKSLVKLIEQRRMQSVDNNNNKDLLELMIKASYNNNNSDNKTTSFLSVNEIVEECKTIFFAGKQTTANLMTWTTVLLAMHPRWQDLAREEVLRVCGARDPPSNDHLANLKTVGMILKESLRLYPPAVATIRRAKANVRLGDRLTTSSQRTTTTKHPTSSSTLYDIPAGTELLIPIIAVHHDPSLWGPTANEFDPSRFSSSSSSGSHHHPMAFLPFGLGSRRCVGQNLAFLQVKLAIAMILQRFSFELSPAYHHSPTVSMMLHPQYGAPVVFTKL